MWILFYRKISPDLTIAREQFKEFNERMNSDECLDDTVHGRRLSDDEARLEIKKLLGEMVIAQVKSFAEAK